MKWEIDSKAQKHVRAIADALKDDNALILQGALPAAMMALAVQAVFELAERVLVPRGLRLPVRD